MKNLKLKLTVLMLFPFLISITASSYSETITVKTFLIQFENTERIDAYEYYQNSDFILKFQWEPEGLYLITRLSTEKKDVHQLIESISPGQKHTIENPILRDLPERLFNKL